MGAPEMTMGALGVERLFGVKDKTVLVTGGARGIGLMIAAGFVANGAKVYIASRSVEACEAAASVSVRALVKWGGRRLPPPLR